MRKLSILQWVAIAGIAFPLQARAEEGRPIATSYTARETGVSDLSWVTAQDERGVLYFGFNGVVSFDGERWHKFAVPGSYAVRALAFGPRGRLWVGAVNEIGYFDRTESGLGAYRSLVSNLPQGARELGNVWQVFTRGDGAVFMAIIAEFSTPQCPNIWR